MANLRRYVEDDVLTDEDGKPLKSMSMTSGLLGTCRGENEKAYVRRWLREKSKLRDNNELIYQMQREDLIDDAQYDFRRCVADEEDRLEAQRRESSSRAGARTSTQSSQSKSDPGNLELEALDMAPNRAGKKGKPVPLDSALKAVAGGNNVEFQISNAIAWPNPKASGQQYVGIAFQDGEAKGFLAKDAEGFVRTDRVYKFKGKEIDMNRALCSALI